MSEGSAVVFHAGDRVKYEYKGDVDYGVVTGKDGSIYTDYGSIWVYWYKTNMIENSSPKNITLIKRNRVSESKTKHPPHKYAGVIKHWADGGEIQYKYQGSTSWETYVFTKSFPHVDSPDLVWRIKPETEIISYRVGITKDNQVKVYHKHPTLDDAYGSDAFKEWLDPEWRTIEVEK